MKKTLIYFFALIMLALASCNKDDSMGTVSVYLHDDPGGSYEKIKIKVKGVAIFSDTLQEWVTLTIDSTTYDLLTLDSTNAVLLGDIKIKAGDISQVKLIVGSGNSVTIGGVDFPLILDAADLDKLKVDFKSKINGGGKYKLYIDFKAAESIDENGGIYKLKASIKIKIVNA